MAQGPDINGLAAQVETAGQQYDRDRAKALDSWNTYQSLLASYNTALTTFNGMNIPVVVKRGPPWAS